MSARTLLPFEPALVAPWAVGEGPRGALFLHGFAGTPPELRGFGDLLAERGWACSGPALAGHALTPEHLARTGWRDWAASAVAALDELHSRCERVVVVGQSMGGTLALHLAANDSRIAAVATLAAPVHIDDPMRPYLRLLQHVIRWHRPSGAPDLFRREAVQELHSYGRRPVHAIAELFSLLDITADELALIRAPVMICQGGRDGVVDPVNATLIRDRLLCSAAVEVHRYPRSGHALSVDVDREDIGARLAAWCERWVPADHAPARPRRARPRARA